MCGRFLMNEEAFESARQIAWMPDWIQGELRFGEIFPSNKSLVLKNPESGCREKPLEGGVMEFGFYSDSMKKRIINARAETAQTKWMFRRALKHDRCVVVSHSFFEWDALKQKVEFTGRHSALYLAAVYIEDSFIILTTQANASMEPYHSRMPLILDEKEAVEWVQQADSVPALLALQPPALHPYIEEMPRLF